MQAAVQGMFPNSNCCLRDENPGNVEVHNGQIWLLGLASGVMMLQGIAGRHVLWSLEGFLQCVFRSKDKKLRNG